ncbi:helix-turn-helix domain-containing protein [Aneurinibacillus uraniidurans]|uniref:AlbA family DNA-binding domain-containing protein n=1 Tax=Aneurinibacillus uraniidurans TaxID=2966586 RepID=UPI00234A6C4C|nr:ATP-binding protein [Aneurinibacillus sp. B1]WCN36484.1 ATP-binding protein [Aneurinibacillus sp. B1]
MLKEEDVIRYIEMARAREKVENPKIELKREWWKLEGVEGQEEFIKDVAAMVNTPGEDGYFIIGIDEENGELYDAPFPSEGKYNDPAKLGQLVYRKIQEPMTIESYPYIVEGRTIYVLEVPRSFNKPHIIKQHKNIQNFIPIRKSTGTRPADKFDLDLMYLERNKIVVPPYRLDVHVANPTNISFNGVDEGKANWTCIINVLNTGININMIVSGELVLLEDSTEIAVLQHTNYFIPGQTERWNRIKDNTYIKIPPNDIVRANIGFCFENYSIRDYAATLLVEGSLKGYMRLTDVSGNIIRTKEVKLT